ncbi:hypothetical protein [Haloarcula sp. JP-L23]|uniref:hypothetical protein n=1 Tax=Haloarcula sp. JP-L23 TaxID=2716717 RepID=UPI00140F0FF6|nr:hypothetical protein G9465_14815 [Haloarcula sp. JP-L23]
MSDRRTVLGGLSTALFTSLAGCNRSLSPTSDGTDIPSENDRTADTDARDTPHLSEPCSVSSIPEAEYPAFPSEMTEESAKAFAVEFEKRFAEATFKNRPDTKFGGFDGWTGNVYGKTKNGFFIEVNVSVDFSITQMDEMETDLGSEPFHSWYYIDPRFASRSDRDPSGFRPNSRWETVACP